MIEAWGLIAAKRKEKMPVIQMPSGLSIRTYDPAPTDFNPFAAPDRSLLHHGFPPRPDPQTSPKLRELWEHAFSRELTYIIPTFSEIEGKTHGPLRVSPAGATGTSENWSGSVVVVPDAGHSFRA